MSIFKELYQYRELLKTNVKKEIRGKYKGSILGIMWSFLNPLLMVLVYAIVFPYLMRMKQDHYLVYLITGIIPWTFFSTIITNGCNCIWINGGIIKKVYFPRVILPISIVSSALVNFLISCIIILLFVIFGGVGLSINILWLPVIAFIQALFCLGVLLIFSSINVYVRDIEYLLGFIINLLFYLTPIVYRVDMFPEQYRWMLYLNAMTHFVDACRNIFYYQVSPHFSSLGTMLGISLVILTIGYMIYSKLEKGFAEEV